MMWTICSAYATLQRLDGEEKGKTVNVLLPMNFPYGQEVKVIDGNLYKRFRVIEMRGDNDVDKLWGPSQNKDARYQLKFEDSVGDIEVVSLHCNHYQNMSKYRTGYIVPNIDGVNWPTRVLGEYSAINKVVDSVIYEVIHSKTFNAYCKVKELNEMFDTANKICESYDEMLKEHQEMERGYNEMKSLMHSISSNEAEIEKSLKQFKDKMDKVKLILANFKR